MAQVCEEKGLMENVHNQLADNTGSASPSFLNRSFLAQCAPIPLRLIVGFGFMEHGYAKLLKGPMAFTSILHALGVPGAHLMAWLTILTELVGGMAVFVGAFIPLVSVPMTAVLLVAIFTVHLPFGFSSIRLIAITPAGAKFGPVGYECNIFYLASIAALVLGGAGPLSVDAFLAKHPLRFGINR